YLLKCTRDYFLWFLSDTINALTTSTGSSSSPGSLLMRLKENQQMALTFRVKPADTTLNNLLRNIKSFILCFYTNHTSFSLAKVLILSFVIFLKQFFHCYN